MGTRLRTRERPLGAIDGGSERLEEQLLARPASRCPRRADAVKDGWTIVDCHWEEPQQDPLGAFIVIVEELELN
jgi:hypothetical protein